MVWNVSGRDCALDSMSSNPRPLVDGLTFSLYWVSQSPRVYRTDVAVPAPTPGLYGSIATPVPATANNSAIGVTTFGGVPLRFKEFRVIGNDGPQELYEFGCSDEHTCD
jgi:hypothetical protein